jgi:uncharacterized membrane protein
MSRQRTRPKIPHPALVGHARERAEHLENRIADRITSYAGSMHFVYLHIGLFAAWMILIEESPWPTLTLIVSLEAIFLSTFVLISQNRADEAPGDGGARVRGCPARGATERAVAQPLEQIS